ncbi:hypothetical protein VUR80DRAFT_5205 [Thermomyces stellatus]
MVRSGQPLVPPGARANVPSAENHLSDEVAYEDDKVKIVTTHGPMGVVGAIAPWNFPLVLGTLKIVSALITGNCVILKPSPFTPYASMKVVELCRDIVPPGVVQVLNGGADLGAAMTLHPGIAKITFTGSIPTGRKVLVNCSKTMKRVTLELGGNDAAIVCEDVDVPTVAEKVATGSFANSGQVCVASKRVYVHESIYDEFLDAYVKVVEAQFKAGGDAAAMTLFGPLSNRQQFDIIKGFLEDSKKNNHKIVAGGKVADKGLWVEPTVVAKPPENSRLVREEQFGECAHALWKMSPRTKHVWFQALSCQSCRTATSRMSSSAPTSTTRASAPRSTQRTWTARRRSRGGLRPGWCGLTRTRCQIRRRTSGASRTAGMAESRGSRG